MFRLLKYMKNYRKECVFGPLLKLLEAALELLVPYVILDIINVGIANGDVRYIAFRMLLLIIMGFVGLIFSVSAQYFSAKAAVSFSARVREAVFSKIMSLDYSQVDKIGRSSLITALTSDMNQVQSGINLALRLLLRSPFIVFGAMIMAFTIDVNAALVFAGAIPVLLVIVFVIMLTTIPLYKKVQQKLDVIVLKARENLSGVRMLRALCKEKSEENEFNEQNDEFTSRQKLVGKISSLMNPLTYVVINIAIIVLIYVGAVRVEYGILGQGAVLALYNYMSQILVELIKLANLIIQITKSIACGNRVQSFLEIEPLMKNGDISEASELGAVRFDNVSFGYNEGGKYSLENISFSANKGQTVGIIGGTGSGKNTLVNLICRFYDADEGNVYVGEKNVRDYSFDALRTKVGIVPQGSNLFRGTVAENIRFGNPDASDDEVWEALALAQADGFIREKDGLATPVEQGGANFSGGQRQRLTIARALVRKPDILILDDSSSALDYATDLALRRAINSLSYSPTVFIVSQRASTIMHADIIIVLDDGRSVGIGKHDDLILQCEVYREIYNSQTANA